MRTGISSAPWTPKEGLRRFLADISIAEWFSKPCFDAHKQDGHDILDVRIFKKPTSDDYHQILVKSTLSPLLMQALTFGEKDIKRRWDY